MTSAADVQRARELIGGVIGRREAPAGAPKPEVYIDSLAAGGAVNLTCGFYVEEPRMAYKARSDCYFELLDVLQANKIAFAGPGA